MNLFLNKRIKEYFKEKTIPLEDIICVAADGTLAMMGCHCGFIALLKKEVPDILSIHYVIHRQHLVAKHLRECLHQSLQYVTFTVNKVCSNSSHRIFTSK